MTTYNKATLKTYFETGDVPSGTDYGNLIDSCVNMVETSRQTINGPIQPTELIAPIVSATNVNVTGTLNAAAFSLSGTFSAANVFSDTLSVSGVVSAGSIRTATITATSLTLAGKVSASSINVTGDVSAVNGSVYSSALRMGVGGIYRSIATISAAGTTLATGAIIGTFGLNKLAGIVNDATTGFTLNANLTGLQQTLYVAENTSCNLWPAGSDYKINGLSSGAAFSMAGNSTYIVTHLGSAYAVK